MHATPCLISSPTLAAPAHRWLPKNPLCQAIALAAIACQAPLLLATPCPATVTAQQSVAGCTVTDDNFTLTVQAGGVINGFTATSGSPGHAAAVYLVDVADVTIDNYGLITATDPSADLQITGIRVTGAFDGTLINHSDATIQVLEPADEMIASGITFVDGLAPGSLVVNYGDIIATNRDEAAVGIGASGGGSIEGSIINDGTIHVSGNFVADSFNLNGLVTSNGSVINGASGQIIAEASYEVASNATYEFVWATGMDIKEVDGTIANYGQLTVDAHLTQPSSTQISAWAFGARVNLNSDGSFTNTGTIRVTASVVLASQLATAAGIDVSASNLDTLDGTINNHGLVIASSGAAALVAPPTNHIARSLQVIDVTSADGIVNNFDSGALVGGILIDDSAADLMLNNYGLIRSTIGQTVELHNGARYRQIGNGYASMEIAGTGVNKYYGDWNVQGSGLHLANGLIDVFVKTLELDEHLIKAIITADDGVSSGSGGLDARQTFNPNPFWEATAIINENTLNVDLYLKPTAVVTIDEGDTWTWEEKGSALYTPTIFMPSVTLDDNDPKALLNVKGKVHGQIDMYNGQVDIYGQRTAYISGPVFGVEGSQVNIIGDYRTADVFDVDQFTIQADGALWQMHTISVGTGNGVGDGVFENNGTHVLQDDMTVDGNYYLGEDGTLQIDVSSSGGATTYNQFQVTGSADLRQGQIRVVLSGELDRQERLTGVVRASRLLLKNNMLPTIDSDDVYLWSFFAQRNPDNADLLDLIYERDGTVADAVLPDYPYALSTAKLLDEQISDPDDAMQSIVGLLDSMTKAELGYMAAQNVPVLIGQSAQALTLNNAHMINRIQQRMVYQHRQPSPDRHLRGQASGNGLLHDRHIWIQPIGNSAELEGRDRMPGYDIKSYGLAVGADKAVNPSWLVGGAIAYHRIELDGDTVNKNQVDIDSWQFALYGRYTPTEQAFVDLVAVGGLNTNDSERRITFSSFNQTAKANYDGQYAQFYAGTGYSFATDNDLTLTPVISLTYTMTDEDSYRETGAGALNLAVHDNDDDALVLALDVIASLDFSAGQLNLYAGGGYDFLTDRSSLNYNLISIPGQILTVSGNKPNTWVYRAGVGLEITSTDQLDLFINYDYQGRKDFDNHIISAAARWAF